MIVNVTKLAPVSPKNTLSARPIVWKNLIYDALSLPVSILEISLS